MEGLMKALVLLVMAISTIARPAMASPDGRHQVEPDMRLEATLDAIAARTMASGTPGLSIAVAGPEGFHLAKTYGLADLEQGTPVTADTVLQIASLTKQFTAAATLLMVEDGKLSLDDKLSRFVPELAQADRVTIRQLLTNMSGLPDYADDPEGDRTKSVARTPQEMLAYIARLKPSFLFEPGTSWAYSNSNYQLLGLAVSRAAGKPLQTVFAERLFAPAGMTHTAFDRPVDVVPHRARGYRKVRGATSGFENAAWISPTVPGPAGGLRSTVRDLLAWNKALYGGRILKPASLGLMTSPGRLPDGSTNKAAMPGPMRAGWNSDYGMGVLIGSPSGRARIWHSGDIDGFASWMAYYPDAKATIIILHNSQSAERFEQEIERAFFETRSTPAGTRR